ncbi:hypothetical protein CC1G_10273 [Coprinopsis cinerea okayama7|uniref:ACB domain-containing protein n=1 Tax=Coprinopsis cinerea (strain Okayama-7 / 130 / ATCC MYA-4618 / FGSC 9003) TaxID=240176 RepID=A8N152_COPC7|nr:hypothetical protein CC1G_10273 [Coprinopsis cinerea okayama7\|eukprot:XP_001828602.1 hypothetical protein CC1G_10273 [Coprinopsis cinerea okayama7\
MTSGTYTPSPSFNAAVAYLSSPSYRGSPSNATKLELYALFKYTTTQSAKPTSSRPGIFDFTGRAKWDAWAEIGSKYRSVEEAERRYVELARELGWDGVVPVEASSSSSSGPERSSERPKAEEGEEEEIQWDSSDDDESSQPPKAGGSGGGGRGGGQGLGVTVSAVARPEEESSGDTKSLHGVVLNGDLSLLQDLLNKDPTLNLDAPDEYGYTPLHLAADRGHVEIVKFLLSKGANPTLKDPDEFTPLELAQVSGNEEIVAALKEAT